MSLTIKAHEAASARPVAEAIEAITFLLNGGAAFWQALVIEFPLTAIIARVMTGMRDRNHRALSGIARYSIVGGSRTGSERSAESQCGKANHDFETHVDVLLKYYCNGGEAQPAEIVPRSHDNVRTFQKSTIVVSGECRMA